MPEISETYQLVANLVVILVAWVWEAVGGS